MAHSLADGASNADDVGDAKNESTSSPVRHDACHETADKRAQRCRRGDEFLEAARKMSIRVSVEKLAKIREGWVKKKEVELKERVHVDCHKGEVWFGFVLSDRNKMEGERNFGRSEPFARWIALQARDRIR